MDGFPTMGVPDTGDTAWMLASAALVLLMTAPALIVFGAADQVDWGLGALLAIGQSIGAFAAARFASRKADADVWIRRVLLIVLPATTVKLWFFS